MIPQQKKKKKEIPSFQLTGNLSSPPGLWRIW